MISTATTAGSVADIELTPGSRLRKRLAFVLNIIFWLIFFGTFALDFQERSTTPETQLSEIQEVIVEDLDDFTLTDP